MMVDLEACRAALGPLHPNTLTSMHNLACLLKDLGRLSEAEALAREALAGWRSALGDAHPHTQNAYRGLFGVLTAQGKHSEARELKTAGKK